MASVMETKRVILHKLVVATCVVLTCTLLPRSNGEVFWTRFESVVSHSALSTGSVASLISTSLKTNLIISKIARKICTGENVVPLSLEIQERSKLASPCGQIHSPLVPSLQRPIWWELSVPPELSLNLTFTHFHLPYSIYGCQRDWVDIKRFIFNFKVVLWRKCGQRIPWSSLIDTNRLELEFSTWDGESYFRLLFQVHDKYTKLGEVDNTYMAYPDLETSISPTFSSFAHLSVLKSRIMIRTLFTHFIRSKIVSNIRNSTLADYVKAFDGPSLLSLILARLSKMHDNISDNTTNITAATTYVDCSAFHVTFDITVYSGNIEMMTRPNLSITVEALAVVNGIIEVPIQSQRVEVALSANNKDCRKPSGTVLMSVKHHSGRVESSGPYICTF